MPAALAAKRKAEIRAIPIDASAYETVTDLSRLREWIAAAVEQGYVAIDTETNSLDAMQAELAGFSHGADAGPRLLRAARASPRRAKVSTWTGPATSCRRRSPRRWRC